ncbi:MAG: hypothetical protein GY952_02590 [Rhodobacteraceae bacterium]|nr:hypothetical protein [Paracoccaceae bacterium]
MSVSNDELLKLVEEVDRDCALSGIHPARRSLEVPKRVCEKLGIAFVLGANTNPDLDKISSAHKFLYRSGDMGMGAVHTGVACHLDLFFRVDFPLIYGSVQLDFLKQTDASENQLRRIFQRKEDGEKFLSNIVDVFDIGGCIGNYHGFEQPNGMPMRYMRMAAFHNQAFSATLTGTYNLAGAVQSSLLCAELSTKAALLDIGKDEDFLKTRIGHNLDTAVQVLREESEFEVDHLSKEIGKLPHFVKSRYEEKKWTRLELAEIALASQSILANICRKVSGGSFQQLLDSQASDKQT